MSLRADFMAQKRLDEEEKEIKTIDQLKADNDSLKRQLQFEFDETLLQYSNTIEDLQKQLKDSVMKKCPQCGEIYLNPIGCELYEQLDQLKKENEDLKKWKENVIDLFNRTCRCKYLNEETTICNLNNKECISINECMYRKQQTLTEIKEIVEPYYTSDSKNSPVSQILQKISECEAE